MADLAERNTGTMSEQFLLSSIPYHSIFVFVIPLLVGVLQVSVQGSIKSLFETHPINMHTFLLSTFIYCLALAAQIKCKLHQTRNSNHQSGCFDQLFGAVAVISGSLSTVLLVSVLLPRLLGLIIFIALAIIVLIIVAYRHPAVVKGTYHWLHQEIKDTYNLLEQKLKDAYYWLQQKVKVTYDLLRQKIKNTCDWLHQNIFDEESSVTEQPVEV